MERIGVRHRMGRLAAAAAVLAAGAGAWAGESEEDLLERVRGAVVTVFHEGASGSGFIISPDGYLWTNGHVVQKATRKNPRGYADRIVVSLDNGKQVPAKVLGYEMQPDCALLKIEVDEPLPVLKLGDTTTLRIGQKVFAIGAPYGFKKTVTKGILSNTRRNLGTAVPLLQHDAEINPGNSGGPLINEQGEVVGINTYKPGGYSAAGIGAAFPIYALKALEEHYKKFGKFKRANVPHILVQALNRETLEWLNIPGGSYVGRVLAGSAAEKAGFKAGDVITAMDGKPLKATDEPQTDTIEFVWDVMTRPVGSKVGFTLLRNVSQKADRQTVEATLTLEERPMDFGEVPEHTVSEMGVGLKAWTPSLEFQFRKTPTGSVNASSVIPGGAMDRAGVAGGDFITAVEGTAVTGPEQCEEEFHRHMVQGKKYIGFTAYRDEAPMELVLAPEYSLKEKSVALVCPGGKLDAKTYERVMKHLARAGAKTVLVGMTKDPVEVKAGERATPQGVMESLDLSRVQGFVFLDAPSGEKHFEYPGIGSVVKAMLDSKKPFGAIGAAPAALLKAYPELAKKKTTFRKDWLTLVSHLKPNYTGQQVEQDGSLMTASGEEDSLEQFLAMFDQALKTTTN